MSPLIPFYGGQPVNQAGTGVNVSFNPDGTGTVTTGANFTPANWFNGAPIPGIGGSYWIKFTDTGLASGTATAITNNGVVQSLSAAREAVPAGGIGARNYSFIIYADAAGTIPMSSGAGQANNTI